MSTMFLLFCASADWKDYKQVVQNPYGFKRSLCPIRNCDTNLYICFEIPPLCLQSNKPNDAIATFEKHIK